MNPSVSAKVVVWAGLIVAGLLGAAAYWRLVPGHALALLIASTAVTFCLALLAVYLLVRPRAAATGPSVGWRSWRHGSLLAGGVALLALSLAGVSGLNAFGPTSPRSASTAVAGSQRTAPEATAAPTTPAAVTPTPDPVLSATPASSPATSPSGPEEATTPAPGAIGWLDTADPVGGGVEAHPVVFLNKRYPRGVVKGCRSVTSSYVQWNVAGWSRFEAVAGISDDTENSFGVVAEMIFYDQDGRQLVPAPIDVSVGHPQPVSIDLRGVVNLRMTCSARDAKTQAVRYIVAALGDPRIVA